MKKAGIIVAGALLLSLLLLVLFLRFSDTYAPQPSPLERATAKQKQTTPDTSATTPDPEAQPIKVYTWEEEKEMKRQEFIETLTNALSSPISFYGKVVDEQGTPVPNADVGYRLRDKFMASGTTGGTSSDALGNITITGVKGAAITVTVDKEGYYYIENVSSQSFSPGGDSLAKPYPTKDNPAIFILRKMGETVPLIKIERNIRIARNGMPIEVNLETGEPVSIGNGHLIIEAWTEDETAPPRTPYNWKCRITVPDGGLTPRHGEFNFEAPLERYEPYDEIIMLNTAERWQPQETRDYYLKLKDGRYARINFTMRAGGEHFFTLYSYMNPKPGSRNLEYDPKKEITVRP